MKRGGPLKRSKPLRPYGKRAKRQAETPRALDVPQKERRCELAPYLACVLTWGGYEAGGWNHPEKHKVDRHHFWNSQRHHDEEWAVVWASRLAHEFCHDRPAIGKLVSTWALHCAGRFDHQAAKDALGFDPIGKIASWLEGLPGVGGYYDGEPMLASYARKLIAAYPGEGR